MAVLSVLTGGVMGFFSAIAALLLLNISWLAAIGLWTGIGTLAACAILGVAMVPRKTAAAPAPTALVAKNV